MHATISEALFRLLYFKRVYIEETFHPRCKNFQYVLIQTRWKCFSLTAIVALATLFCKTGKVLSVTLYALITEKLIKPRFTRLFPSCWKGNAHCRMQKLSVRVSLIKTENLILQLFVFDH